MIKTHSTSKTSICLGNQYLYDVRNENGVLRKGMSETIEKHKTELAAEAEKYNGHVLNFLKSNHLKGLQYADKDRSLDINMRLRNGF